MEQPNSPTTKNPSESVVPSGITTLNDSVLLNQPEPRYECPICYHWLRDPVITTCGHKFCRACITPWIQNSGHCPLDNVNLSMNVDIFPDNYTKREIQDQRLSCPHTSKGCTAKVNPFDFEAHIETCEYNQPQTSSQPDVRVPCAFQAVGCKETFDNEKDMSNHLNNDTQKHLSHLMNAYSELKMNSDMSAANIDAKQHEAMALWDAPDKNKPQPADPASLNNTSALIRSVFERVVILEQRNREQAICIANLTKKIDALTALINYNQVRYCMGTYIWKIENFKDRMQKMIKSHNSMLYSPAFYTSPYGYRFCVRLNISPQNSECFALHLHMMKSEFDDCLDWPFNGRIAVAMINQYDSELTQRDTMMSISHLMAFQKPTVDICPRGFGFTEYATVKDVFTKGFVKNDTLIIKVQIKNV